MEPQKKPKPITIENTLKAMQNRVGGLIELVGLSDTAVLICNDEGKLLGLEPNRRLGNHVIAGSFLIVGIEFNNPDFVSLSDQDCEKYTQRFRNVENISVEECQKDVEFRIISF